LARGLQTKGRPPPPPPPSLEFHSVAPPGLFSPLHRPRRNHDLRYPFPLFSPPDNTATGLLLSGQRSTLAVFTFCLLPSRVAASKLLFPFPSTRGTTSPQAVTTTTPPTSPFPFLSLFRLLCHEPVVSLKSRHRLWAHRVAVSVLVGKGTPPFGAFFTEEILRHSSFWQKELQRRWLPWISLDLEFSSLIPFLFPFSLFFNRHTTSLSVERVAGGDFCLFDLAPLPSPFCFSSLRGRAVVAVPSTNPAGSPPFLVDFHGDAKPPQRYSEYPLEFDLNISSCERDCSGFPFFWTSTKKGRCVPI